MVDSTSSLLLAVIVGGGVALLGVLVIGYRIMRNAKETSVEQIHKLDNITILVDGRYSEVLQELADVKALLAKQTGDASDLGRAEQAQRRADDQAKRVDESKEKR